MLTVQEAAYIAGLVDGEGCLFIRKTKQQGRKGDRFTGVVTITNSHKPTLDWIATLVEGSRVYLKVRDKVRRPCWELVMLASKKTLPFLKELRPYLRIKAEEADVLMQALALQALPRAAKCYPNPDPSHNHGKGSFLRPEFLLQMAEFRAQLQQLKQERQSSWEKLS